MYIENMDKLIAAIKGGHQDLEQCHNNLFIYSYGVPVAGCLIGLAAFNLFQTTGKTYCSLHGTLYCTTCNFRRIIAALAIEPNAAIKGRRLLHALIHMNDDLRLTVEDACRILEKYVKPNNPILVENWPAPHVLVE